MTIKKLTVAAAIAVGIATCSFSSAMAACPCNTTPTMSGCPCQQITTPATAPCPICGQSGCNCKCQPQSSCGCNNNCGCGCNNNCGCADTCCDKCKDPACSTCPDTSCNELDMKQVYAYPSGVYGSNNYVGEQTNAIYSTQSAWLRDYKENLCQDGLGVASGAAAPMVGLSPSCGCCSGAAAPLMSFNNGYGCGCKCPEMGNPGVSVSRSCGCNSHNTYSSGVTGAAAPIDSCSCLPIIDVAPSCGCFSGAAAPCNGCNSGCGCGVSIQSADSIKAIERSFSMAPCAAECSPCTTGCAAPLVNTFPDVPSGYWAGCDIDRLAATNVIAGYPDRTYKPTLPVSRAEFASMMVKGFNLNIAGCDCLPAKKIFKDVPLSNWANPVIAKAVEEGIMCGCSNGKFMPKRPVSRAEALTAMAHGINCDIDSCKAKSILSQYCDGDKVPDWAQIPVAKALETGVLKNSPAPNTISPCKDASRADIASMLQSVRIAAGYDKDPTPMASSNCCPTASSDCGCKKTSYMATEQMVKIPTLKVKFADQINAKSSHVGERFAAKTTEDITINGVCYPCGSMVHGKIVEVIRPSGCQKGALKVAFTSIDGCGGCSVDLPKQILTAQVSCTKNPNIVAKIVEAPFTLLGSLIGTTGRTVGGAISNLGNAAENVSNSTGIALGDVFQGQLPAAGRSLGDAIVQTVKAPIDVTRTALAGTVGLFQTTGDEIAFLVDANGNKISQINPREQVTIAFGCH